MKSREKDLTVGSPGRVIFWFMLPILLSTLLQNFYNLVDTAIIGKFLDKQALAGVGATGALSFMVVGLCIGIATGFSILVAQRFGARDYSAMRRFITNGIWAGAALSILLAAVVCFFLREILELMNTPQDIIQYSYDYIFIIFLGVPVTIAYNFFAGIIRSLGDSKTPFFFLLMASVINIGFDLLAVLKFNWGVRGPAVATILSQLFSVIMCLIVMIRKMDILTIQKGEWKLQMNYIKSLLAMGLPFGLQYSITAVGSVVLQHGVNSLGSDAVAAVTAASKVSCFLGCPGEALGSSMATYTGQNLGAGKIERIHKGLWAATAMGIVYSVCVFVVMIFTADKSALLFLNANETQVIANARQFLLINTGLFSLLMFVNTFRFTIQGMGYSAIALFAGVFEMFARAFVGTVLVSYFGFDSVCFANPAAWLAANVFLIPAFYLLYRRLKNKWITI